MKDKSPLMRYVSKASWFLTALGSIQLGLATGFGGLITGRDMFYPLVQALGLEMTTSVVSLFHLLVGVSGLISMVMFFTCCCCKKK